MKNGMLPCPHCGARPRIAIIDYPNERNYRIECSNNCLSFGEKDEVIKNWNSRADFAEIAS